MHATSTGPGSVASGRVRLLVLVGIAAVASMPVGCGGDKTCEETGLCVNAGPGGDDDNGGGGDGGNGEGVDGSVDGTSPLPPDCDLAADAKDSPACVDDAVGVFVDGTSGLESNPGTKTAPVKSIGAALGKLGARARVYVCGEGPYEEQVEIASSVSLYGGFACTSWTYEGNKAKVAPPSAGYALRIAKATSSIVIADFAFAARNAVGSGGSSIAVFLADSADVTLRRVDASAGKGMHADNAPAPPSNLFAGSPDGSAATDAAGAPETVCACKVHGSSTGGKGGDAGDPPKSGKAGTASPAAPPTDGRTGAGGRATLLSCTAGGSGPDGAARAAGAGAAKLGALTASGWTPEAGSDGEAGNPGGGGGGGTGGKSGGGPSGGCGGCGGSGGLGGNGGGASIALAALNTTLRLETVRAQASDGGKGGDASGGEVAGGGGASVGNLSLCGSGRGGNGAGGSGGGGGAGGISVGIVRSGGALTGSPVVTLGTPGVGGVGAGGGAGGTNSLGTGPSGLTGSAGKDGVAEPVLVVD